MTREARIVVLAWSLLDAIRQPRTSMSDERLRRPSPSKWQLCGTCDGTGTTTDRFGRSVPCLSCGGLGRYEIDAYTESRVTTMTSTDDHQRVERVGCSWCQPSHGQEARGRWETLPRGTGVRGSYRCEHCDGSGWRTLTLAGDDTGRRGKGGELVAWTMHGDWPALLAALEQLRRTDRRAHKAFLADAVHGEIRSPTARRGLEQLARVLPRRLHVPGDVLQAFDARHHRQREAERKRQARLGTAARRARDREIREARRRGVPPDVLAAAHGVSERTVRRAG